MKRAEFQGKAKRLEEKFVGIADEVGEHFSRLEAREVVAHYLRSLLSHVERKNAWQMAEAAGQSNPYAFQNLLGRSSWEESAVRDDHVRRVGNYLGSSYGILAIDETGFLKKGTKSAGVARQYSGTAGKVENCQIGVFLSWKTRKGQTLLDRELYLPREWTEDRKRCKEAGISKETAFKTKPELAKQMLRRVFDLGIEPAWVVADEVYGRDGRLRFWLEEKRKPYVLAVSCNQSIAVLFEKTEVRNFVKSASKDIWQKISAGTGSKGPRFYEWALLKINHPYEEAEYQRWALFRRSLSDPDDMAYYLVFAEQNKTLHEIVLACGSRWSVEECFESSKGEVGLDHYEVRNYRGWYRHIILVMIAHSILVISRSEIFESPSMKVKKKSSMTDFKKKRGLL